MRVKGRMKEDRSGKVVDIYREVGPRSVIHERG